MAKVTYQIPFDKEGNQVSYDGYIDHVMLDNFEFDDILVYVGYGRGRSAVTFEFKRKSNGKTVNVFLTNLDKMMKHLIYGEIVGTFTFSKRGSNYGCKFIE